MMDINNVFGLKKNDIISVVGAGGKTSLISSLAKKLNGKRLISPSTKMYQPKGYPYIKNEEEIIDEGVYVSSKEILSNQKLSGINPLLSFDCFDYVLIEADGSSQLPVKGWRVDEPVIENETTVTIGVVDITTIGKKADEKTVFRLNEFKDLVGDHSYISQDNLFELIVQDKGLFKDSLGYKILYFNKIESEEDERIALRISHQVIESNRLSIDKIVIGSVKDDIYKVVYSKYVTAVLASGLSKRMGENKLLIPIKGQHLIEYALMKDYHRAYRVVIGKDEKIKEIASENGYSYINNINYEKGQSESIKIAVSQFMAQYYMFVLGDQPFISQQTVDILIDASQKSKSGIIACKYNDVICTPVIFNKKYKKALLDLKGDQGGKAVIKKNLGDLECIEISEKEYTDLDTKDDIDKWCK